MQGRRNNPQPQLSAVPVITMAVLMLAALALPTAPSAAPHVVGSSPDWRQAPIGRIAVSTPIFAHIVANVAGDRFEVFAVMSASADPHTFEASPQDMVAVSRSRSFIYMGANLEPLIDAGAWRRAVREAGISELRL